MKKSEMSDGNAVRLSRWPIIKAFLAEHSGKNQDNSPQNAAS
jgi:hypothetical protein